MEVSPGNSKPSEVLLKLKDLLPSDHFLFLRRNTLETSVVHAVRRVLGTPMVIYKGVLHPQGRGGEGDELSAVLGQYIEDQK